MDMVTWILFFILLYEKFEIMSGYSAIKLFILIEFFIGNNLIKCITPYSN